jgi:hypothetical protein
MMRVPGVFRFCGVPSSKQHPARNLTESEPLRFENLKNSGGGVRNEEQGRLSGLTRAAQCYETPIEQPWHKAVRSR